MTRFIFRASDADEFEWAPNWGPIDWDVWDGFVRDIRRTRALTEREAGNDLRMLERNGGVLSRDLLAERWGWEGEAGCQRARRLVSNGERWEDSALANWREDRVKAIATRRAERAKTHRAKR